jgi:hypothetical protein
LAKASSSDDKFSGKLIDKTDRISHLLYYNTLHDGTPSRFLVETLNNHERILYRGLHGNPELALLLAPRDGYFLQYPWEFSIIFRGMCQ